MTVIAGSFATQTEADAAAARLKAAGFADDQLAVLSKAYDAVGAPKDDEQRANEAVDGATLGAAVGAVVGGALFGPVGAIVGGLAVGGGVAAALSRLGMSEEEAREFEARLHEGRYAVVVHLDEDDPRAAEARRILTGAGADRIEVEP